MINAYKIIYRSLAIVLFLISIIGSITFSGYMIFISIQALLLYYLAHKLDNLNILDILILLFHEINYAGRAINNEMLELQYKILLCVLFSVLFLPPIYFGYIRKNIANNHLEPQDTIS